MTDDISTRLAANLKRFRDERGLSQQALAGLSGVPRPTVAHLESGGANPTLAVVSRLARSLGVTLDGLLEAPSSGLRIVEPSELRVQRRSKAKQVTLLPAGLGPGDWNCERVELRPQGVCLLEVAPDSLAVVVCERGELVLTEGPRKVVLKPERVALLRGRVRCESSEDTVFYRFEGRALPGAAFH